MRLLVGAVVIVLDVPEPVATVGPVGGVVAGGVVVIEDPVIPFAVVVVLP
jgi:hypothetical protein